MGPNRQAAQGGPAEARLRGFPDRASLEEAAAWLDARPAPLAAEEVPLEEALGRVPARPILAPAGFPARDTCLADGHALRAAETLGASPHDPCLFRRLPPGAPVAPGGAVLVSAGDAVPRGADAVLPFELAEAHGSTLEVAAAVAEGAGVERASTQVAAGAAVAGPARLLRPQDLALLRALGVRTLPAVRRPGVRLAIAGPRATGASGVPPDLDGPLLGRLVERDGGVVRPSPRGATFAEALGAALAEPGDDLLLVVGRTGTGADDDAPRLVAASGTLALHGIALRPGGSAGLGLAGGRPVVLLPGDPLGCLVAYELLAGRLLRRLAGRDPALPHPTREAVAGRKLVSAVGFTEVCQVRLEAGRAEPVSVPGEGGLGTSAAADGFVVVPAALEGYAPRAHVTVHLYQA